MHTSPLLTMDFLRNCWRPPRQLFFDTLPCTVYAASVGSQCKTIMCKACMCWYASSRNLNKPTPNPPSTPMSCHGWHLDRHPHVLRSILTCAQCGAMQSMFFFGCRFCPCSRKHSLNVTEPANTQTYTMHKQYIHKQMDGQMDKQTLGHANTQTHNIELPPSVITNLHESMPTSICA